MTVVLTQEENRKAYMTTQLEEHYVLMGESEGFHLTHFSPENESNTQLHIIISKLSWTLTWHENLLLLEVMEKHP